MDQSLLLALHQRRPEIRARWEALLRVERLHTPLADPNTLVFMFDLTLDEVLAALPGRRPVRKTGPRPTCRTAGNPMRDYFSALEQALLEALVHAQAAQAAAPSGGPAATLAGRTAAVRELRATLHRIARREIAVFDNLGQPPRSRRAAGRVVPAPPARPGS